MRKLTLAQLERHLLGAVDSKYRLCTEDFEFPDLLGAAYEYLIGDFADSAGKKGGEFYTPRAVVRLMVRLADPREGMRVYDPCSGSGGMLILSAEYVREHGGNPRDLGVYGQEDNGGVWSISSTPARIVDAAERRHEVGAGHGEALARGAWPRGSISGGAVVGVRSHA